MGGKTGPALGMLVLLAAGCAGAPEAASESAAGPMAPALESVQHSWKCLVQPGSSQPARPWEWATAIPTGMTRAEVVVPLVAGADFRRLVPTWPRSEIRLASAETPPSTYRIAAVNGQPIANWSQLHAAATKAAADGKKATVGVAGAVGQPGPSVQVEPGQLVSLAQVAARHEQRLRVTEDGNPWVVLRQDGICCRVMARVERPRHLLHVALALDLCWGQQAMLPREVKAACDGVPLQCLTVAGTLETLYGSGTKTGDVQEADACSFAAVSEREDYLVPSNYNRLQKASAAAGTGSGPEAPALANVPGVPYPGPAVLGDARALAAFLQQRQLYSPGERERVGWIMFTGDTLRQGSTITLDIDLGRGVGHLSFTVPGS